MKNIAIMFLSVIYKFFWIFRIKKKKIVITSFYGKGYGDSGKYICNELYKRRKDCDIVWLAKNVNGTFPKYIRVVKYGSLKGFYELATAHIWIDNSRKRPYYTKRKKQFYLQTWHSNLRLKKIEKDAEKDLDKQYIWYGKRDSKMIDAIIVGCDFSYNTMRNSFYYDGPIYKTGIPRCDELFNNSKDVIDGIKKKLNVELDKKLVLYAPTFRKGKEVDVSNFDVLIKELQKKYKDNFVVLLRFHPISKQEIKETKYIKNVTNYPDMQELIKTADVLVTDYSGCMFDAAICHKKCILYIPDYEDYLSNQREIYFDFKDLPFPKAYKIDELANSIVDFDDKKYNNELNKFLKFINCYENGSSAKNVVDLLEEVLPNEKI